MGGLNKAAVTAVAVVAVGLAQSPLAQAADRATAARFTAAVNEMVAKYHLTPIRVSVDKPMIGPDVVAQSDGSSIELSIEYGTMTPAQFNAALAHNMGGYHPSGCDPIRMAAIHEVGHVIDARKSRKPRKSAAVAVGRGQLGKLHGAAYDDDGSINPGEALAVSFSAVECGSATPSEVTLYHVLVD